jgi:hypothetical protein
MRKEIDLHPPTSIAEVDTMRMQKLLEARLVPNESA